MWLVGGRWGGDIFERATGMSRSGARRVVVVPLVGEESTEKNGRLSCSGLFWPGLSLPVMALRDRRLGVLGIIS